MNSLLIVTFLIVATVQICLAQQSNHELRDCIEFTITDQSIEPFILLCDTSKSVQSTFVYDYKSIAFFVDSSTSLKYKCLLDRGVIKPDVMAGQGSWITYTNEALFFELFNSFLKFSKTAAVTGLKIKELETGNHKRVFDVINYDVVVSRHPNHFYLELKNDNGRLEMPLQEFIENAVVSCFTYWYSEI